MDQAATEPLGEDTFLATCAHTHLFPGARCRIGGLPDPDAFAAAPRTIELALRFADDVVTPADLCAQTPAGTVLRTAAYTTGAGTSVEERSWLIREVDPTGGEVVLVIGGSAPA
ncbi:hypothetical protein ABZ916_20745 [Streptomyces sp. NPDC046853]|uniref:hypothetical protein n=1 Tax=Streptomyces sp. NPDC046853 TaxID=3154920 RepID=UPI0033E8E653